MNSSQEPENRLAIEKMYARYPALLPQLNSSIAHRRFAAACELLGVKQTLFMEVASKEQGLAIIKQQYHRIAASISAVRGLNQEWREKQLKLQELLKTAVEYLEEVCCLSHDKLKPLISNFEDYPYPLLPTTPCCNKHQYIEIALADKYSLHQPFAGQDKNPIATHIGAAAFYYLFKAGFIPYDFRPADLTALLQNKHIKNHMWLKAQAIQSIEFLSFMESQTLLDLSSGISKDITGIFLHYYQNYPQALHEEHLRFFLERIDKQKAIDFMLKHVGALYSLPPSAWKVLLSFDEEFSLALLNYSTFASIHGKYIITKEELQKRGLFSENEVLCTAVSQLIYGNKTFLEFLDTEALGYLVNCLKVKKYAFLPKRLLSEVEEEINNRKNRILEKKKQEENRPSLLEKGKEKVGNLLKSLRQEKTTSAPLLAASIEMEEIDDGLEEDQSLLHSTFVSKADHLDPACYFPPLLRHDLNALFYFNKHKVLECVENKKLDWADLLAFGQNLFALVKQQPESSKSYQHARSLMLFYLSTLEELMHNSPDKQVPDKHLQAIIKKFGNFNSANYIFDISLKVIQKNINIISEIAPFSAAYRQERCTYLRETLREIYGLSSLAAGSAQTEQSMLHINIAKQKENIEHCFEQYHLGFPHTQVAIDSQQAYEAFIKDIEEKHLPKGTSLEALKQELIDLGAKEILEQLIEEVKKQFFALLLTPCLQDIKTEADQSSIFARKELKKKFLHLRGIVNFMGLDWKDFSEHDQNGDSILEKHLFSAIQTIIIEHTLYPDPIVALRNLFFFYDCFGAKRRFHQHLTMLMRSENPNYLKYYKWNERVARNLEADIARFRSKCQKEQAQEQAPLPILSPEDRKEIAWHRKNISLAILGKAQLDENETWENAQPKPNKNYLYWMQQHTSGWRWILHFVHGQKGIKHARDLLKIAYSPTASVQDLRDAVEKTYQRSGAYRHSLSRYLKAAYSPLGFNQVKQFSWFGFRELKKHSIFFKKISNQKYIEIHQSVMPAPQEQHGVKSKASYRCAMEIIGRNPHTLLAKKFSAELQKTHLEINIRGKAS